MTDAILLTNPDYCNFTKIITVICVIKILICNSLTKKLFLKNY